MARVLKTLIVDDESLLRDYLRDLLRKYPSIEVVAEASGVKEAVAAIRKHRPDLIFLDIKFPGETGFDVFEKIDVQAKVIFVTAFDEYAVRAFEINALDYLLKPINPERLAVTLKRIASVPEVSTAAARPLPYSGVMFLNMNDRYHFIRVDTILRIHSAGCYTEIVTTTGKKGLVQRTMKTWEMLLPPENFARIHRSTIINVEHVERIEKSFNDSYKVYLRSIQQPELMSRRYLSRLKNQLG